MSQDCAAPLVVCDATTAGAMWGACWRLLSKNNRVVSLVRADGCSKRAVVQCIFARTWCERPGRERTAPAHHQTRHGKTCAFLDETAKTRRLVSTCSAGDTAHPWPDSARRTFRRANMWEAATAASVWWPATTFAISVRSLLRIRMTR